MMRGRSLGIVLLVLGVVLSAGSVVAGIATGYAVDAAGGVGNAWPFAAGLALGLILLIVGIAMAARSGSAREDTTV